MRFNSPCPQSQGDRARKVQPRTQIRRSHSVSERAMLSGIPAVTEQQTKGNTPRVDCRPLIPEGAHSKFVFRPRKAVAFAYAHVTRRGHFGQWTGQPQRVDEARRSRK